MRPKIVIVGSGAAAINAIKGIREIDGDVGIELYGEEEFYPYYRLRLTKSLFESLEEERILLQKKDWYQSNRVNVHLNVKVQGVDVARHEIILAQGERRAYDRLLLANGASNRPPRIKGARLEQLKTIRHLADARRIRREMEGLNRIIHIGGGIQGLETAWSLRQHQKEVVLVEVQTRLIPNQLDETASAILKRLVEAAGIKVLTDTEIEEVSTDNGVQGIVTKEGQSIPGEMVLYSTGIQPNIGILKGTPLRTNRGVLVNDKMETNVEHIYAAGDVAELPGKAFGLWSIAMEQGKIAGYNMVNQTQSYQPVVPVTMLNAYGSSLFSMGDVADNGATQAVISQDLAGNTYRKILLKDQIIIGAILIGDTRQSSLLKTAIEKRLPLTNLDLSRITVDGLIAGLQELKQKRGELVYR